MEYLSAKLANYILKKGLIDTEAYEIYQYGFQCFLEVSVSTICSLFLALLLHMLPECLFLPIIYSTTFIWRWPASKNLLCLFYWIMFNFAFYSFVCKIFYHTTIYFLCAVCILRHLNPNNRTS